MEEIWKDIEGYKNLYQISNKGNVKSLKRKVKCKNGIYHTISEKILKPCKNGRGYLFVNLQKEGKIKNTRIHRLVANAFIQNPYNLQEVNHIDEDKTNNNVENLEWCTREYNVNYGYRTKLAAKAQSKKVLCVETNIIYQSTREAERQLGLYHNNISNCCNGKQNTCGGYKWRYVE